MQNSVNLILRTAQSQPLDYMLFFYQQCILYMYFYISQQRNEQNYGYVIHCDSVYACKNVDLWMYSRICENVAWIFDRIECLCQINADAEYADSNRFLFRSLN